ncbi:hypothetical protein A3B18_01125 [Candidatus Giovannonibacteria bacterium RIFCSPLOWO2_01_FULL_46_13]|uniref:Addiction module toxin, HicA family n=1 Tax=Candidatus Giovannonibacteria bacterium RIFCSPLOWO2_01_FULL_46_13 TaxID=1798352 RepID=A0A1F5X3S5_9BACT|nr:MAG: hypothetical protein A3B18_01125 [Candidatus Giovannonibacteria bacterium RIFCSPLOWO2_01_FULL_46_13]
MIKLPQISGKEMGRALERLDFTLKSRKGSHMKYVNNGKIIIVPDHKILKKGTLHSILRQLNLNIDRFRDLL